MKMKSNMFLGADVKICGKEYYYWGKMTTMERAYS